MGTIPTNSRTPRMPTTRPAHARPRPRPPPRWSGDRGTARSTIATIAGPSTKKSRMPTMPQTIAAVANPGAARGPDSDVPDGAGGGGDGGVVDHDGVGRGGGGGESLMEASRYRGRADAREPATLAVPVAPRARRAPLVETDERAHHELA